MPRPEPALPEPAARDSAAPDSAAREPVGPDSAAREPVARETEAPETRAYGPLPEDVATAPARAEAEVLRAWRERGTFEAVQRAREGAAPFVFWEGPPTANGRPGIHHVLARAIKDAVCRFQTMQGRRVVRKAGWDTHGLPVELEVEKALGISGKPEIERFGVAEFNARCRESVWKYKKEWEELSERIGYWLDYEHPYVTYEPAYVESVWSLLARFHRAGLVYRGRKVLPYCGRCGTGLSSHELGQPGVYRDVSDPSVVVAFRVLDPAPRMPPPIRSENEALLAWTTTPWTLPCNFALAVHPEREYVRARVRRGDRSEVVWVVAERATAILPKGYEEIERRRGADLVGCSYEPLFHLDTVLLPDTAVGVREPGGRHRVHAAGFVTVEDGAGIVHQAAYGEDDWQLATRERIPAILGPGPNGRFDTPVFRGTAREPAPVVPAGTWFKDADAPIVADLKGRGLLFSGGHATHSYPHCWRCSTPLFYFPAPAWYVRTTALKDRMVALNRRIRWVPSEVGEKRFGEWLENNVDWNISRDRYWGTPLPFWVCDACDAEDAIDGLESLRARAGALPEGFDAHKPAIDAVAFPCADPGRTGCRGTMRRTKPVLDCWFDSGAMPFAQYHWPFGDGKARVAEQFPADFIAEGLDQTRGWFYTLHAIGAFATSLPDAGLPDGPAFRACVVNGLVLDKDGVKMSKRLGNVVDPWKEIEAHGADALRWYLLGSGAPGQPKRFDPAGVLEVRRKLLGTLENSYRFLSEYARLDRFDPGAGDVPPARSRPEIDRWILSRTQSLNREFRERMSAYDLAGACRALEAFVVDELSNWYIRRNRRRFWRSETGADKLAAFATLHQALETAALLGAPALPFHAEMLWERLRPGIGSVHAQRLPEVDESQIDPALEGSMRVVTRIVEMGRALRERAGVKTRQPLRAIHVRSSDRAGLELLAAPFATDLVLGELNIKGWGSLAEDDGRLCRLRAKPNFRTLGKRVGPRMKALAARIEDLPAESIARLRAGGEVTVDLEDGPVTLAEEDVLVSIESRAEFDVETDGRHVVYLDTLVDDDLLVEGIAREAISRINNLRKEAGLAVEDRVRLRVRLGTEDLRRAFAVHAALISGETLAVEIGSLDAASAPGSGGAPRTFDLGEGREITISLERA